MSSNVDDDRLSMLPEPILSHILSLMPTKFAVRTSILSKRWMYTWMSVTNFDFEYTCRRGPYVTRFADGNEKDFTEFVDRVFKSCTTPHIKLFRLHVSNYVVRWSSISNWVDNAVSLNVRELDLCLLQHKLPLSVVNCNTLTSLRLELSSCEFGSWEFPSPVHLPYLKTLALVGYTGSSFDFLCGCPVLESLSLEVSCHNKQDCIFDIPTLKYFKLIYDSSSKGAINKVFLRVPKLEYLFVGGILGSFFVMEDVSSLVEASIMCWESTNDYLWDDLLNKIRTVQNLSIKEFRFTSPLPIFPNLKQLELNRVWKSGQITHFLKSCPELNTLCVDSVDWTVFKCEESSWIEFDPTLIPACMLTNLTTIKFSKCEGDESDIAFLEYMLGNAQVLKAVTVCALENLLITEEHPWFCAQVLQIPKASVHCEIHFRPWKLPPSEVSVIFKTI